MIMLSITSFIELILIKIEQAGHERTDTVWFSLRGT